MGVDPCAAAAIAAVQASTDSAARLGVGAQAASVPAALRPVVSFMGFDQQELLAYKQPLERLGASMAAKVDHR